MVARWRLHRLARGLPCPAAQTRCGGVFTRVGCRRHTSSQGYRVSGKQNLIMGLWARQPFRPLQEFIASLRHIGFAGDVCLCVEEVSAETVTRLRTHGIIVERTAHSAQPSMTALASRYFSYLDILTRHADRYAKVMLTDPGATILQSDPFAAQLPADIVYTQECRRLGASAVHHDAVVQAYGESVAHNLRDCPVSNADTTLGTMPGVLRYLAAMTRELSARTMPITGAIDEGVHNYVVHMRALRDAWLDPSASIVAAMRNVGRASWRITEQGVLIHDRQVPVLLNWDSHTATRTHVRSAPQYLLGEPASRKPTAAGDAVVVYYSRERDAEWLVLFLDSLRCANDSISVHCVGDFDQDELATLAHRGCIAYPVAAAENTVAGNVAHVYLSQVLDRLAAQPFPPDQVLVLDGVCALFPRDPFLNKTIGLSVFCEGPKRIGESAYNRDRLAFFVMPDERRLQCPVVSSALLRGSLPVVRKFYRRVLAELVGRGKLLNIEKVIQGVFNKLCHDGDLGFPVITHPNGAEAYFDSLNSGLAIDTRHGVRVGGTVPGVVIGRNRDTELMIKLRIELGVHA
jgi:hypothetical protein